jgi:adenylate kinase family enzyme
MRCVVVNGISGSGKTTVGQELARRLGVPHVELDALRHGPGWQEATDEELRRELTPFLAGEGWVVDGNYHDAVGDLVLARADTVLWIELPLGLTLARLLRRTARRLAHREELWNGNRESFRAAFVGRESLFGWALHTRVVHRREFPARYARHPQLRVVHLWSSRAVAELLAAARRPED